MLVSSLFFPFNSLNALISVQGNHPFPSLFFCLFGFRFPFIIPSEKRRMFVARLVFTPNKIFAIYEWRNYIWIN